ncbi:MAG: 30S ribosomal protein S1 [Vampirovibrionales bacterium]
MMLSSLFKTRLRKLTDILQQADDFKTEFTSLLEDSYGYSFQKGQIIQGKVIAQEHHGYHIDIGAKTHAVCPYREVADKTTLTEGEDGKLALGTAYEFFILRNEDQHGVITLSRKRVAVAYAWKQIEVIATEDRILECAVIGRVRGGLLGVVEGVRGFIPRSHLGIQKPLEELIGTTIQVKILTLDAARNNLILSHKKVLSEQQFADRREQFEKIDIGAVIEGKVVRLADFGAFVDLGGVDGLLPLSQMSWRWVEHPGDLLKVGDSVKVEVISVDAERQRISLSVKSLQEDPWITVERELSIGKAVEGSITRVKNFGAFVEIITGVEALLPSRELHALEQQRGEKLQPGTVVQGFINRLNVEERRVSMGLMPIADESSAE